MCLRLFSVSFRVFNFDYNVHIYDIHLQECLKFLKGIHYGGSQDFSTKTFYPSNAFSNIYLDTASTFLKVLWHNSSTFTTKFLLLCRGLNVMLYICQME